MSMADSDSRRSARRAVRSTVRAWPSRTAPTAAPAPEPRVHRFLEQEAVLWLTATTPDGRPHVARPLARVVSDAA